MSDQVEKLQENVNIGSIEEEVVGDLEVQLSVIDAIDGEEEEPDAETAAADLDTAVETHIVTKMEPSLVDGEMSEDQVQLEEDETEDSQLEAAMKDEEAVHQTRARSQRKSVNNVEAVHYAQRYRVEWEKMDFSKDWISPYPQNEFMAWCKPCNRNLFARKNDLIKHSLSQKHQENMRVYKATGTPASKSGKAAYKFCHKFLDHPSLREWLRPVPKAPHRSWCSLCACFLAPQLNGLILHSKSLKHNRNLKQRPAPPPDAQGDGSLYDTANRTVDEIAPRRRYNKRVRKPRRPWTPTEDGDVGGVAMDYGSGSERDDSMQPAETDFSDRVTFSIGLGGRKVGFLGAGQMAQSMAQGMLDQGLLSPLDVMVSAPSNRHMAVWRRWKCRVTNDNDHLLQEADIVVIAVKSNVLNKVIKNLKTVSDSKLRLFISVIPGVSRQRVYELLTTKIVPVQLEEEEGSADAGGGFTSLHVVRCAPNKMMSMGAGFCAYCMANDLPHALYLVVETIFSSLGTCVEADEALMDAYTTTVGCGAAFTCAFIESLVQGTVNLDVPWEEALKAATCVVLGTAKMLLQSGRQPAELRRAICTPGGSTIAGVAALQRGGLDETVVDAMEQACQKTANNASNV